MLGPSFGFSQQITFAPPDISSSVSVSATTATRFRVGGYEVLHLAGDVKIRQQNLEASANEAIMWVEIPDVLQQANLDEQEHYKIIIYLESDVVIERSQLGQTPDRIVDEVWLGRLFTSSTVDLAVSALRSAPAQWPARAG